MRNLSKIFISFFIFTSCSYQPNLNRSQSYSISYAELQLPVWFLHFPEQTEFSIGISYKTDDFLMIESAKESAAILYSRNKASITIDKYAQNYQEKASFSINITANPDELYQIKDSFTLVDTFSINEYFIGLFSVSDQTVTMAQRKRISNNTQKQPSWFQEEKLEIDKDKIVSSVHTSSSSLLRAFQKATEEARLSIASYLNKEVYSEQIMRDRFLSKFVSIETNSINENFHIETCYVSFLVTDSLPSYHVYLKMSIF